MEEAQQGGRPPFKDPRPTVERISQLAQRVLNGDILLPKFQRDFVWPRSKVLGLLDSIARNYPIGSILLWQSRQELASERTIAGLPIAETKPDYPVNYLLDGQQRLSTVCGALYWQPSDDPDSLWNIVYDLRSGEFAHLHTLEQPPLTQVPLHYLSDAAAFFRRTSVLEDEELSARADALFNRVQDYMIAAVTLGDMPMQSIAPIFERINSNATPLTIVDLMRAATWAPHFDLRDSIDEIRGSLADRNFDTVGRKTVLRAIAAAAGFGFAVDDMDRLRTRSVEDLKSIVEAVALASKRGVDFLSSHVRVPRPEALPYANQFAVLTELFRLLPMPSGAQYAAIERWFWRTTLSGYYGGWNTGQMAHDHRQLRKFSAGEVEEIEVPAALPRDDVWRVTQFRSNSAVSKMLALLLSYQEPVDILTNQRIDARRSLAWNNDREYHHFFPRAFLRKSGASAGQANSVANIVLLSSASNIAISDRAPSDYLSSLIEELGEEEVVRRLDTVLVSRDALGCALRDDYAGFLRARAATLQQGALTLVGDVGEEGSQAPASAEGEVLVGDQVDVEGGPPEFETG